MYSDFYDLKKNSIFTILKKYKNDKHICSLFPTFQFIFIQLSSF